MLATQTAARRIEAMSVGQILDRSIRLFGDNFGLMLGISAIANCVPLLLVLFKLTTDSEVTTLLFDGLGGLAGLVVMPWLNGAVAWAISERYLSNEVSVGEALSRSWHRLGALIAAQIRVGLWVFLGVLMLLVPGILWGLSYSLVLSVVMIEDVRGRAALDRSWSLVDGQRRRVFNVAAAIGLVTLVLMGGGTAIIAFGMGLTSQEAEKSIDVLAEVLNIAAAPFWNIAYILLYYDLRIRKEGFDLEVLSQELSHR